MNTAPSAAARRSSALPHDGPDTRLERCGGATCHLLPSIHSQRPIRQHFLLHHSNRPIGTPDAPSICSPPALVAAVDASAGLGIVVIDGRSSIILSSDGAS